MKWSVLILTLLTFSLISCSSRPKLYPNRTLKVRGVEVAEADIDQCIADADTYLGSSRGKNAAKGAGAGAVIGGAMGAVSGIFSGNVGKGALQGAAIGGAGGGAAGALSPDQIKRRYVNQCLAEKGYQVIGWD